MRAIATYSSLLAIGLLVGGLCIMLIDGGPTTTGEDPRSSALGLDFQSLFFGLVLGLVLANLSRVAWTELPRRFVAWLLAQENNLFYGAIATMLLVILIAY